MTSHITVGVELGVVVEIVRIVVNVDTFFSGELYYALSQMYK
jgi:hypothetical protein